MNDQNIEILISILEKIETGQKEQKGMLAELQKQGSVKQPLNPPLATPPTVKIDYTALFEKIDHSTRSILGAIEKVKPLQEQAKPNTKLNYSPLVLAVLFVGMILFYKYYLVPRIQKNTRIETIQEAVRYYTVKNKRDKLSIDRISKSIDSSVYYHALKTIK